MPPNPGTVAGTIGDPSMLLGAPDSFGSGGLPLYEEGNITRQIPGVSGAISPGATAVDSVLAVFSLPANTFDNAGKGIMVTAAGNFGATVNNKRIKIIFGPTAAVVGQTVTGGTVVADTGTVATNGGGWEVTGNVFKKGAPGSNTQHAAGSGAIAGGVHAGTIPAVDIAAAENAPILVAITGNATTAVSDILLTMFTINAMN